MFPHYLFLFLKPSLKEQRLGGWWAKAWPPGSRMGFTQIAVPTGLYLEAMPWLVSTHFYLLGGAGDQTQGITYARCACTLPAVSPPSPYLTTFGDPGQPDCEALVPPAGRPKYCMGPP